MPHMVIFRTGDGKPGYHQTEGLDDAVRFVERVRNHEHVSEARIFRMHEIPIEVKTYFKVEVAAPPDEKARADDDGVKAPVGGDEPVSAEAAASGGGPNNRFPRFNRG